MRHHSIAVISAFLALRHDHQHLAIVFHGMSLVMLHTFRLHASRTLLAAVLLAATVSGCAGQRQMIQQDTISRLDQNSTRDTVYQELGRPTHTALDRDGGRTLLYLRKCANGDVSEPCASAPKDTRWQRCEFRFDKQDHWVGTACSWATP